MGKGIASICSGFHSAIKVKRKVNNKTGMPNEHIKNSGAQNWICSYGLVFFSFSLLLSRFMEFALICYSPVNLLCSLSVQYTWSMAERKQKTNMMIIIPPFSGWQMHFVRSVCCTFFLSTLVMCVCVLCAGREQHLSHAILPLIIINSAFVWPTCGWLPLSSHTAAALCLLKDY